MNNKQYDKIQKVKNRLYVKRHNLGEAGEYLVAGKLLLNGFNIYKGAIDDGIDLVARKRKKFYFIQVKTCQNIGYDSGEFMARINLSSLSKFPENQTFLVLVLHYLGSSSSVDNMGDHNTYEQEYVVLPYVTLKDFFQKNNGTVVFRIYNSLIMPYKKDIKWLIKLRYNRTDFILDEFLFNSFWQIEV